ncbi:MAG: DNA polymerase III subunit delta' [Acidobacteriota bacterium]
MPFSSIAGHRRLIVLLSRAVARGTLPPSLLFAGPAGVGKWRVAQATAQALNCQTPASRDDGGYDACGTCRACDRVARGVHVDVAAVEPDDRGSIKIDVVRDVLAPTAYRPFEGRRRVVLVRDADALEPQAQNALLKSLEEPPASTVFILTTSVPGALLPTVRSRCMRLRFGPLRETELAELLVRDAGYDPGEARAAAALADGSVGQALALGSTDLAVLRDAALVLLRQADASPSARLQAAAALVAGPGKKERSREDLALVLRMAASLLRDIEVLHAGADARLLANPALAGELAGLGRALAGERARAAFAAVDRALAALERNAGTKVVAEWLAMQV